MLTEQMTSAPTFQTMGAKSTTKQRQIIIIRDQNKFFYGGFPTHIYLLCPLNTPPPPRHPLPSLICKRSLKTLIQFFLSKKKSIIQLKKRLSQGARSDLIVRRREVKKPQPNFWRNK